jgi:DNA-binding transcriptional regulator WhiA
MDISTELEIIEKRRKGVSIKNICQEYKIDKSRLYRILHRNGREKIIPNKKYSVNDSFFENIDSEEKAYWLGFFYADGYVSDKKGENYIELGLSSSDKNHILLFANCIESNYPIKNRNSSPKYLKKDGQKCESTHLKIYNSKLVNDLIKLGCMNKKSWKITYPNFIKSEMERHFIRGYFDGDGSVRKRGPNQYEVSIAGNYDFINGLKRSIEEKGIKKSYITVRKKDRLASLVISNNKDCTSFYKLIYENINSKCFLKRKKSILDNITNIEKRKDYKSYKLTDNNGEIYTVNDGLEKFCKKMMIDYLKIKKSIDKNKSVNGWKIERIIESTSTMRYIKLFEEFIDVVKLDKKVSSKDIEKSLNREIKTKDPIVFKDTKGVYQIKNWKTY